MNTYRMATVYDSTGNPLCDKLKREFRGRGAEAAAARTTTSQLASRVRSGLDPYETAAVQHTAVKRVPRMEAKKEVTSAELQRRLQNRASHSSVSAGSVGAERSRSGRPAAKMPAAKPTVRTAEGAKQMTAVAAEDVRRRKSAAAAAVRAKEKVGVTEVKLARAPFPFAAVSMLAVFTMMIMVIIFSIAQNYELSSEISMLEAQARELAQLEKDMALQLEERDDIRVIEDIAVNQIGMVKDNLVESRFVSVSGGNRVELLAYENEEEAARGGYSFFSNMLSALGENLEKIRDYIE